MRPVELFDRPHYLERQRKRVLLAQYQHKYCQYDGNKDRNNNE